MSKRPTEGGGAGEQPAPKRALTKAEAAVYDRQLRVWGVEAQQRMMSSKVLVVGVGGVACEICKNLILGGVGQLTMMDHQKVPPSYARPIPSIELTAGEGEGGAPCSCLGLVVDNSRSVAHCHVRVPGDCSGSLVQLLH